MTDDDRVSAQITVPCVVSGMPDEAYHRDPVPGGSLSSTGARKLLPPSCPARFAYEREHPPASSDAFDFGKAAHQLVLGDGPEITALDFPDWRTKEARELRDDLRAAGRVPLLRADYDHVVAMAAALRGHPMAAALFAPGSGVPEQSLFWVDEPTGVWRRARVDWLPHPREGRLIVPDYKTCQSALPRKLARSVHEYGYHQQAAWYLDGIRALGVADDAAFVFVCQEKTPPYLVTVVELDSEALAAGARLNRRALETYAACTRTGIWPGYTDDVELISLPPYALSGV